MTSFAHTGCGLVRGVQRSRDHTVTFTLRHHLTLKAQNPPGKTVDRSQGKSHISAQLSLVSSLVAGSDIPENGGGADVESDTQQSIVRHSH